MAVITCSLCDTELRAHCAKDNRCGWLRCVNPKCVADTYDTHGGRLRRKDGSVEPLGA